GRATRREVGSVAPEGGVLRGRDAPCRSHDRCRGAAVAAPGAAGSPPAAPSFLPLAPGRAEIAQAGFGTLPHVLAGREVQRLAIVLAGIVLAAEHLPRLAAPHQRRGVAGTEADGLGVVGDGTIEVVVAGKHVGAVAVGQGVARIEADRFAVVGDGAMEIGRFLPYDAEI